jgi:hypothetical protein
MPIRLPAHKVAWGVLVEAVRRQRQAKYYEKNQASQEGKLVFKKGIYHRLSIPFPTYAVGNQCLGSFPILLVC